ncbi:MAG TPA: 4'-phosphopantetheinyl transferase superfamily protein [Dictyobacter sp.]|jgi:4'-phosphopantetheinyl transferase|nr:4'-phosphopantetheinyl transferase superfamily protein [Dictyobacter sp.]
MTENSLLWNTPPSSLALSEDEVHIWRTPLSFNEPLTRRLRDILIPEEQTKAQKFYFEKDRQHWTAARAILRILLGMYLNIAPSRVQFHSNQYGKPSLALHHASSITFNLSHSQGYALYAFTHTKQLGIDIEYMKADIDYASIAQHYFSPYEQETLASLPAEKQKIAFYYGWTRKEAYIKARGKGLSIPLNQFDVTLQPGKPAQFLQSREPDQANQQWSLYNIALDDDFAAALAVENTYNTLHFWSVETLLKPIQ